jgi:hypothetical protein
MNIRDQSLPSGGKAHIYHPDGERLVGADVRPPACRAAAHFRRPRLTNDLPNEFGVPNHNPDGTGIVDNHNTVTGTGADGKVIGTDWALTCHDWTTKVGTDGTPRIGFSWRGGGATFPGNGWYTGTINEAGCAAYINLTDSFDTAQRGIGSLGGYGGLYCLALTP